VISSTESENFNNLKKIEKIYLLWGREPPPDPEAYHMTQSVIESI
jgi:hypothetical protein